MPKTAPDPFRGIFQQIPVPLLLCEVGTLRVLAASELAARLHGARPRELEGDSLLELRRFPEPARAMLERASDVEMAFGAGDHTRRDGSTFQAELTVHPSELNGRPAWLCVLGCAGEQARTPEPDPQRRLFESVGRVAGGVAHDINNLLSVVLSFTGLVSAQLPGTAALQADLGEIRAAAERASRATKQLLHLSSKGPPSPKPVLLNDVVLRLEKLVRRLLDERMSLELSLEDELDQVLGDTSQLERLLVQLAGEARVRGIRGSRLLIETKNTETTTSEGPRRQVLLRVSNCGASPSELTALAPLLDGAAAWLESESGSGARFVACFPSLKRPAPGSWAPEPRKVRRQSVLVVQDNPHLRKTLRTYFAREGYRVLDADSSLDALRILEQEAPIELLLTDYCLTDGSGGELSRAARQILPDLRVLIATSHPEQRAAISEDERTATIGKPFDLNEFAARIDRLLRASPGAQP